MDNELIPVLGVTAVVSAIVLLGAWIAWILGRRSQERIRGQIELQSRVLEKFASAPEFVAFTASESGRKFLESFSTEHGAHVREILASVRKGAVMTLAGLGLCVVSFLSHDDYRPAGLLGTIALATGIGYLISAWASYRLSRSWGLLPPSA